jgi:hypothetical protein
VRVPAFIYTVLPVAGLPAPVTMDMLFSPYGVGGMPKATMAEIERTTEELLKSSSFQRMLDLENKYKVRVPFATIACLVVWPVT